MNSFDKHAKALEFDKVLEKLADFTSCEDARFNALHLKARNGFRACESSA